jgi:hypothetical protein
VTDPGVVRLLHGEQLVPLPRPSLCEQLLQQLVEIRLLLQAELGRETRSKLEGAVQAIADALAFHARACAKPPPGGWMVIR